VDKLTLFPQWFPQHRPLAVHNERSLGWTEAGPAGCKPSRAPCDQPFSGTSVVDISETTVL